MFEKRGLTSRASHPEDAPPIVVADLIAPSAKRTDCFLCALRWPAGRSGALEKRPVETGHARRRPATISIGEMQRAIDPEWRLYARSAGDDKAPIIAMLAAIDAMHAANVKPSVNFRFVFEGEEEAGSPHLAGYLAENPKVLRPDAWILCDGPVHQSRRPELFFGARGTIDLELTVYGPIKGLHDGHYGNWVPNPIVRLTHLIDSMRDESGHILIKDFYKDVKPPTSAERTALTKIPDVEADLRREFQIGSTEGNKKPLNELLLSPALNVRGIQSGHVGEQASNTIQTEAQRVDRFPARASRNAGIDQATGRASYRGAGIQNCSRCARCGNANGEREDCKSKLGCGLSTGADTARSAVVARGRATS